MRLAARTRDRAPCRPVANSPPPVRTVRLRSTPEAPSDVQARAALAVLLAAALLRRGAATFGPGSALSWLGTSPMAAWLSGWAFGFASMKALRELGESLPGFMYLNLAVSLLATAMTALLILVSRPSTNPTPDCLKYLLFARTRRCRVPEFIMNES